MLEKDLISVIIPVYNVEKYLDDCIRSVLNQTYRNLEIILINDGSTDNSLSICQEYLSDSRVILIDQENKGLSKTRQKGIDILKGEYFCTIDSDDYISPDFIKRLYYQITNNKADISICSRIDFSDNYERNVPLQDKYFTIELEEEHIVENFTEYSGRFVLSDSWNKMYKTAFVKQSNVRFSLDNHFNGTDLLFNHLLILHLPVVTTINTPLYYHRIVETSRVHRRNKQMQSGFIKIINHLIDEAEKAGFDNRVKYQFAKYFIKLQKIAAYDLFCEEKGIKQKRNRINKFIAVFNGYYDKNFNFELGDLELGMELNFFFKCMKTYSSGKLISYYTTLDVLKRLYSPIKKLKFQDL